MSTRISWTDETWNPIRARLKEPIERPDPADDRLKILVQPWGYHCERISPGCCKCYARTMNGRMLPSWGTGLDYTVPNRDKVEIFLDEKELTKPLTWKKPRRVFPCSMTDLFAAFVPDEMIDRVFAVMALSPQHTFQVLTKRADRMEAWFNSRPHRKSDGSMQRTLPGYLVRPLLAGLYGTHLQNRNWTDGAWPLPNVWLGVSVEDQKRADERIPHLLRTPAALRFLSCEPLLDALDIARFLMRCKADRDGDCSHDYCPQLRDNEPEATGRHCPLDDWGDEEAPAPLRVDWLIAGAESGPGARLCQEGWIRSLRDQCVSAGVPFFYKQMVTNGKKVETPELDGQRWAEMPCGPTHSRD